MRYDKLLPRKRRMKENTLTSKDLWDMFDNAYKKELTPTPFLVVSPEHYKNKEFMKLARSMGKVYKSKKL